MEHILNFIWLMISVLLVIHWMRAVKPTSAMQVGKAAIALILLIVVLMPIISATDDLMSMAGLLEGEHAEHAEHVTRRGEMPLLDFHQGDAELNLTIFAFLFVDLLFLSALRSRFVSRFQTVRLLKGFAKTFGMRPPPVALFATA